MHPFSLHKLTCFSPLYINIIIKTMMSKVVNEIKKCTNKNIWTHFHTQTHIYMVYMHKDQQMCLCICVCTYKNYMSFSNLCKYMQGTTEKFTKSAPPPLKFFFTNSITCLYTIKHVLLIV